jgi:hypothetical protein
MEGLYLLGFGPRTAAAFAIELERAALSGKRTAVVDATRMVKQQCGLGIDELCDLTGEATVGNADSFDCEHLLNR